MHPIATDDASDTALPYAGENLLINKATIDELAVRAKIDPIAYRLALLRPDAKKLRNPLVLLDEKSKAWRLRVPRNHAVGIACNAYHESGVACAVEVSIESGRPRIHRATVTADVGMAINPLTLEAQFQGGIVYGLSQLMANGAITLSDGRVDQRNFDGHTPPYMKDAPVAIDVHIVPSTESPTACGECPVPIISPAVVNALFRLTGERYRTLPLKAL